MTTLTNKTPPLPQALEFHRQCRSTEQLRVLRVIPSMNPRQGGPCQGIRNSIPPLANLDVLNEVVCLDRSDADFAIDQGFPIYSLGASRGPWAYQPDLYFWLLSNLPEYDVVIVHGLWQYHSYAVTRAIRQLRKAGSGQVPRVFIMPHGMLDPWFQHDRSRRLKAWRNWFYWKAIEQRVIAEADGLLFTCQKELELAREPFRPYHPRREFNVGYGVAEPPPYIPAMQAAFRSACPDIGERPYLLFLSRIHPKKGVDLLLRAYAQFAKESVQQRPLPALVIAGPTDSAYAREMQQLARTLKLTEVVASGDHQPHAAVYFSGMLKGDAKWGALYGCDAFVLPSHQENFGIAVVEALACRKPVLISDQVNIFCEIAAAQAGIVESDTLDGIAKMLRQWHALTDDQVERMGAAAGQCFANHYGVIGAANKMHAAIYNLT